MTAYYNEIDGYCAQWLRNLIKAGLIAPGEVDERDIRDVTPKDLVEYTQHHFFAGVAGWPYALRLAGWPDDRPVWTGSCPCQSFSTAGRGAGGADERHLWPYWFHLIRVCRPITIFGEQVASKLALSWLDLVFDDLETEGYTCGAADLPACSVGAPHIRQRLWFVANAQYQIPSRRRRREQLPANDSRQTSGFDPHGENFWSSCTWLPCRDGKARPTKPGIFPLAHGVPGRVGQLRAAGNAIVPQVAAEFIRAFMDAEKE